MYLDQSVTLGYGRKPTQLSYVGRREIVMINPTDPSTCVLLYCINVLCICIPHGTLSRPQKIVCFNVHSC
jgi:hypothetical protein